MTADPLTSWLKLIAPHNGHDVAEAIERLPLRPVYSDLNDGGDPRPFCAEWSLRSGASGIDTARVMVAVDTQQCKRGLLNQTLESLSGTPERLRSLAEALLADRPDLDLLLGFALAEATPRAKLYVLRPTLRPIAGFEQLSADILRLAGVDPNWTREQIEMADQAPAFFALDLRADGSSSGKLYFSFDHESKVESLLERLGAEPLCQKLHQITGHVSDNPNGRLVVTTRASSASTLDVTLHAHLQALPSLSPALEVAWANLKQRAQDHRLRPLKYSYASWLHGPSPAESLYYTFG